MLRLMRRSTASMPPLASQRAESAFGAMSSARTPVPRNVDRVASAASIRPARGTRTASSFKVRTTTDRAWTTPTASRSLNREAAAPAPPSVLRHKRNTPRMLPKHSQDAQKQLAPSAVPFSTDPAAALACVKSGRPSAQIFRLLRMAVRMPRPTPARTPAPSKRAQRDSIRWSVAATTGRQLPQRRRSARAGQRRTHARSPAYLRLERPRHRAA
jgi:hypothetical protein